MEKKRGFARGEEKTPMLGLGEEKEFHQGEIGAHDKTKGQKRGFDSFLQYFLPLGHFFIYINSSLLRKIRGKKVLWSLLYGKVSLRFYKNMPRS